MQYNIEKLNVQYISKCINVSFTKSCEQEIGFLWAKLLNGNRVTFEKRTLQALWQNGSLSARKDV